MREDLTDLTLLSGRPEMLARTDDHPYARLHTAVGDLRAFAGAGATAWLVSGARGVAAAAVGQPESALRMFVALATRGELADVRRIHLPRVDRQLLSAYLSVDRCDDWDFRWTSTPPPVQPGEEHAAALPDSAAPEVAALLARAFPHTFTRPGDPQVRRWYGIRAAGRLVACAADRSRGGVGSISAVTVDVGMRGQGLGAALTAAMTRDLLTGCDVVSLGVMTDNERADRLYRRLGFVQASARTSADLTG